jgi:hypothetical protein
MATGAGEERDPAGAGAIRGGGNGHGIPLRFQAQFAALPRTPGRQLIVAVALASRAFGGLSCWSAWGRIVFALGGQMDRPSVYGNFSITRDIYEVTGRNLVSLFSIGGILISVGAIWLGRRPSRPDEPRDAAFFPSSRPYPPNVRDACSRDIEFRSDLAIFGIAVAVSLLSSGLAWVHYPILLFPFLLLVGSRDRSGSVGIASQIVRYGLLLIVIGLLMYPPPQEIRNLLPFYIAVNIYTWNHCCQAAVVITLGLGLSYKSGLLEKTDDCNPCTPPL